MNEATFAVSESGYMDNELGFEYMKEHFEPYTRNANNPRCLIVDGHSSHLTWKVVQFALSHDIHMICLPSKSTHLLQPLDVGCFGVLQTTYERNLNAWLRKNPLSVISKPAFLDILGKTRTEVYTIDCIVGAWRKSRCWPIDRSPTPAPDSGLLPAALAASTGSASECVLDNVLDNLRTMDTPSRLRAQSRRVKEFIHSIPENEKDEICGLLDFAIEKVTKYRDILPQAETLSKLRTGKVRRERTRSRYISGEARVLSHKHVNDGLKRLKEVEEERVKQQRNAERRKMMAEEKKAAKLALEMQWKLDLQNYNDIVIPAWKAACADINQTWIEMRGTKGYGRKQPLPARPKRPLKPKTGVDLSIVVEGDERTEIDQEEAGEGEDEQDLVNSLRAFEISHFGEVSDPD